MSRAVVTLCIGKDWNEMAQLTHPSIRKYAAKVHADFLLINNPVFGGDPGYEKFQIGEFLNHYDRILFLDTDIIVREFCPDLFDIVPERDIGAFIESNYMFWSEEVDQRAAIAGMQQELGQIGWNKDYCNTGVLVVSKRHQPIFDINHGQVVHLHEQTQLNYNIKKMGFWVHHIHRRFNCMDFINPSERFEAYIVHYAGRGYTDEFHNMEKKLTRIKEDLSIIQKIEEYENGGRNSEHDPETEVARTE